MENYLYEAVPIIKRLNKKTQKQLEEYFGNAPKWLIDSFQIVQMEKDFIFIRENEPVKWIYVTIEGTVRAADFRVYGIVYDFMKVDELEAMGGMEIVLDLPTYRATIQTVTPCTTIKIPKEHYEKWLHTDIEALRREAKIVGRYLMETDRKNRAYLFLQGSDRLALYLLDLYKKYAQEGVLVVSATRQDLSQMTGLCVRTVNRAVKKFYESGWLTKHGNKFTINKKQYEQMNEVISVLIER